MAHEKHINDEDETKYVESESISYQHKSNTCSWDNKNWWYTTKVCNHNKTVGIKRTSAVNEIVILVKQNIFMHSMLQVF